jgi:ADP-heptose:LPS heptosyltransferase
LLQLKDPRKVKLEYGKPLWNEVFDHNPRIARYDEVGDFQVYQARVDGLRPYIVAKTAERWTWREYKPPIGELYFQPNELEFAAKYAPGEPFVVVEPHIKSKASPNKRWGFERWTDLVYLMDQAGLKVVQMGDGSGARVAGTKFIITPTFRIACALLARARAAVLIEGGLHHAAAVVGVRSVVIYGSYISPRVTGYEMHRNIYVEGHGGALGCGWRVRCKECGEAMQKITPHMVMKELMMILDPQTV